MSGYGVDTWCLDGPRTGKYARGITLLAQACYRRLITPRGTLIGGDDEANYGFCLSDYLGAVGTKAALSAMPGLVRGELCKDQRVRDVICTATVERMPGGFDSITLDIEVFPYDESESFTLSVAVTEVSTTLLGSLPTTATP